MKRLATAPNKFNIDYVSIVQWTLPTTFALNLLHVGLIVGLIVGFIVALIFDFIAEL